MSVNKDAIKRDALTANGEAKFNPGERSIEIIPPIY